MEEGDGRWERWQVKGGGEGGRVEGEEVKSLLVS